MAFNLYLTLSYTCSKIFFTNEVVYKGQNCCYDIKEKYPS